MRTTTLLTVGLFLGSCSVYAPMQPHMPMLRAAGEAEVQSSIQTNGRYDVGVAYSPLRYVALTAAGSLRARGSDDTTYFYNRQYEVGLGGYWPAMERLLLSGVVGFGQAYSHRSFRELNIFFGPSDWVSMYEARYHRLFGQFGVAYEFDRASIGFTYRVSEVTFDKLAYNGSPIPLHSMTRNETMLFVRNNIPGIDRRWLVFQSTIGYSIALGDLSHNYDYSDENNIVRVREGSILMSVGLVFYPHRLAKKTVAVP